MSAEIEKVNAGPLAVPEHLKDIHSHEGFGNMGKEDMVLPRLSICQSLSPQRKKDNPSYIKGLEEGNLFNTITGENYGSEVFVIPMLFTKSRIFFRPLGEGGGILCQSFNGIDGGSISPTCASCPNSVWGADGKPPLCNIFYNYPSIILPNQELAVISFKSSGLKAARAWNVRMQMFGDKPMFAGVYKITVVPQKSAKGEFFGPVIKFNRFVDVTEWTLATAMFNSLQGKTIVVDEKNLDDETNTPVPF